MKKAGLVPAFFAVLLDVAMHEPALFIFPSERKALLLG
jgi:hypothetical protein